jgi:ATP-dependent helicase/nuclease subunit A
MSLQLTPEQAQAITTTERRVCVDAGAGSGKTRVLIQRIVHLIEQGVDLDAIVAITFTDKAAGEMKDRLRQEFRSKAAQPEVLDNPDEMTRWRELERRVETSRISTIHSFCARLLREHALAAGLDPEFGVLPEAEAQLLLSRTLRETLHMLFEAGDEAAILLGSEYSVRELEAMLRTMLRSRSLIERLGDNLPLEDEEQLSVFWRARCAEEWERYLLSLPKSLKVQQYLARLNTFLNPWLHESPNQEKACRQMLAGLEQLQAADSLSAIEKALAILAETPASTVPKKLQPHEELKRVESLLKSLKKFGKQEAPTSDPEMDALAAQLTCALYATWQQVNVAHTKAMNAVQAVDFDTLITGVLKMLRDLPEVRKRIADDMEHLLIDEFQDTDQIQLDIAEFLCGEPKGPALFIVGDAKQSIYRFRGAEVEVFQDAKAKASPIQLYKNFRSLPDVLEFINAFFHKSGLLQAVGPYTPMTTHRDPCGESRIELLLTPETDGHKSEEYRRDEANMLAARMHELAQTAQVCGKDGKPRPATYGDMAILFRAASNVHIYEHALRSAGVPYVLVAGQGFYEREEIIDLLNLFRTIIDPRDEMSLLGFLRGPIAGLSDESIYLLCQHRRHLAPAFLSGEVPEHFAQAEALTRARDLVATLQAQKDRPLPEFLRVMLDLTAYEAIQLAQRQGLQRASNIRKLLTLAESFSKTRPPALSSFIEYLDSLRRQEVQEGEAPLYTEETGAVTIMTVHKSKGLEFPIVFVPDLARSRGGSRGKLNIHRRLGFHLAPCGDDGKRSKLAFATAIKRCIDAEEDAEEARLLYVALTRAKDWLVLCGSPCGRDKNWLADFDNTYPVLGAKDGMRIEGEQWSMTVRRQWTATAQSPRDTADFQRLAPERIAARIAPIATPRTTRRLISISRLLDVLHPKASQDAPYTAPKDRLDPLTRGSLVHLLFERWHFSEAPNIEAVLQAIPPGTAGSENFAQELAQIAQAFQSTPLHRQLAAAARIYREQPFLLRIGDALVSGTIDAWIPDGALIDYKTGKIHAELHERYTSQILLYAAAIRALQRTVLPEGVICYVDAGEAKQVKVSERLIENILERAATALADLAGEEEAELDTVDL